MTVEREEKTKNREREREDADRRERERDSGVGGWGRWGVINSISFNTQLTSQISFQSLKDILVF